MKELAKTYDPKGIEDSLYRFWQDKKFFHAEVRPDKKPYTIVIPPPNITGQLHMGHALDNTLQDILIRWKRMQGYETLWLPGTDHASIATEAKIVAAMAQEGIKKEDIGQSSFIAFPVRSVTEGIVNAVGHRNYFMFGTQIEVNIFRDRLEITSPGSLIGVRELKKEKNIKR